MLLQLREDAERGARRSPTIAATIALLRYCACDQLPEMRSPLGLLNTLSCVSRFERCRLDQENFIKRRRRRRDSA